MLSWKNIKKVLAHTLNLVTSHSLRVWVAEIIPLPPSKIIFIIIVIILIASSDNRYIRNPEANDYKATLNNEKTCF